MYSAVSATACVETDLLPLFLEVLAHMLFSCDAGGVDVVVTHGWEALFQVLVEIFQACCARTAARVGFEDLLEVKAVMRRLRVECRIHEDAFPSHGIPDQPMSLFCVARGADLESSRLKVVGDGAFDVAFVPMRAPRPTAPDCRRSRPGLA